jgi:iron complex outermembrane receptor protein
MQKNASLALIILATFAVRAHAAELSQAVTFDIQPQSLETALLEFSEQSGVQIFGPAEGVAGKRAPALRGEIVVEEALKSLLKDSGLTYRQVNERTVAIGPQAGRQAAADAPGSIRLAQNETSSDASGNAADARDAGLDEVMVTAQKRQESAFDVPISMTVLGADELEALRVQMVEDFIFDVPNATFYSTGTANPRVSMRGVNSISGGRYDPIAITVDDASYGSVDMRNILTSQVFDVERIEVLRGPQGTLTGSSSLGGTLNMITRRPTTDALQLNATLDVGRFNSMLRRVAVNVPLGDSLALRTVAYTETSDGAVKNIGPAGGSSSKDHYGARVAALWRPTDRLTINAALAYENLRYGLDNGLYIDQHFGGEEVSAARREQLAGLGGNYYDDAIDFIEDAGTDGGNVKIDDPDHQLYRNLFASFRGTYDLGGHDLDLIYGRFDNDSEGTGDLDRSEYALSRNHFYRDNTAESLELRLTSKRSGPLNWVLGVSRLEDTVPQSNQTYGGNGALAGVYTYTRESFTYRTLESQAAFANLFWDVTSRLHLSAGARYTRMENAFGTAAKTVQADPAPDITLIEGELTELDPRVALHMDLGESSMVYAQYATSFRPGYGNDPLGVGLHETTIGQYDVPAIVDGEEVKNYELGFKGRFFDRRLSLALAAFHMDYTDLQIRGGNLLDPGLEAVIFDINAGEGYTEGVELEAALKLTDYWQLQGSAAYVEAQIDNLGGLAIGDDIAGVRPRTFNLRSLYERPVAGDYRASFRIDYRRQAEAYTDNAREPVSLLPAFEVVDLSAGVSNDRWSVIAYAENIFDENYWLGAVSGLSLRGTRAIFMPRSFGLRVSLTLGADR